MILKYIILKKNNSPIIFESILLHADVSKPFGPVKSAGFCRFNIQKEEIKVKCFGESSTLNIQSNPTDDEKIIRESLFATAPAMVIG